ncbi:kumamolisin [Oxalobacteraceae bacterium GrIS 1.11]
MSTSSARKSIPGSKPAATAKFHSLGPVLPDERFEVTVRVRRKAPLQATAAQAYDTNQLPKNRHYLTRDEYEAAHGAADADIQKIKDFAAANDLVVVDSSSERRSVFLSGTAAQFSMAFGTTIEQVEHDGGVSRRRTSELTVPADLADIIEGVFGTQSMPAARPRLQARPAELDVMAHAAGTTFTPPQLAKLYNFPANLTGKGQCIALIELGGGYRTADIQAYFKQLGLNPPNVKTISVDSGKNHPTNANSADGEVMLDIEVAAALAPQALIAVYFAPNTTKGFLDAITMAIHDKVNKPNVISISWGNAEKFWNAQTMNSYDQAFQAAAALGVTICCAAGDAGSGDENPNAGTPDGLAHVDFPASSPSVLGCGGTRLTATGGTISNETVWNDDPRRSATGGGISDFFSLPVYQKAAGVPPSVNPGARIGRGVPDVAGNADPVTGYQIRVDGHDYVFGGTSAVAPLWAGLVALLNEGLGKPVGFLNPLLYGKVVGTGSLRDITTGDNGAYHAKVGWDACTGWGSPNGQQLMTTLK